MARRKDTTSSDQHGFEAELFKATNMQRDKIANNGFHVATLDALRVALLPKLISVRPRLGEVARVTEQSA